MTDTVLWYLHDHGRGHLDRARAVIPLLTVPVVVAAGPGISAIARETLEVPVVALPSDVPERPAATVGPWHHAPSDPSVRARSLALAAVIETHRCTSAVVDVSVEVTVLARLLGLRVVTVRQSGRRADAAHAIGLATADVVWVPQHRDLEPIDQPIDDRWVFTGPFSRFDHGPSSPPCRPSARRDQRRLAVLMVGRGGTTFDVGAWLGARVPAGWRLAIAGTDHPSSSDASCSADVDVVGHREPILPLLAGADVVITSAGWAAVADTVAAGARLVVVPEARPFDEQLVRARALADAGLAVCQEHWPTPDELGAVLTAACSLPTGRWDTYHDGRGADRAADLIDGVHRR